MHVRPSILFLHRFENEKKKFLTVISRGGPYPYYKIEKKKEYYKRLLGHNLSLSASLDLALSKTKSISLRKEAFQAEKDREVP
jgi:hypothetical protein